MFWPQFKTVHSFLLVNSVQNLQFLQLTTSHPAEKVHNLVLAPFFP